MKPLDVAGTPRPLLALAGAPNCGKTTVFNLLTGARQQVGNWPGVTVECHSGTLRTSAGRARLVDLPGIHGLQHDAGGEDQRVARAFLHDARPDLVLQVVDASRLARHLELTAQLLQAGCRVLLILNMVDEARRAGWEVDVAELRRSLGLPVVPMVARKGSGLPQLRQAIDAALAVPRPAGAGSAHGAVALQPPQRWAEGIAASALRATAMAVATGAPTLGDRIDRVVLHEWLGVPIFLGVLYLVFVGSFNTSKVFQGFFDLASQALLVDGLGSLLLQLGVGAQWAGVLAAGIGGSLRLVLAFVPPIALSFALLALLDDSGYMVRAAYAMDRLMRRFGLAGTSLVPMIIGFGCNVPAIMASRIVEDRRGRLLTALVQPFMSCSARLSIYMAFAAALFPQRGGQVVFALYLLGIVVALASAWLLGRSLLRGQAQPFAMELPPYRLPSLHSVLLQTWQRLRIFVWRVGKVITVFALVLLLLPSVGWRDGGLRATDTEHSLLAQGSRALAPLFAPMGLQADNWPAVAGLVAGATAKEVVIGTLNGIYGRDQAAAPAQPLPAAELGRRLLQALRSIPENAGRWFSQWTDPLGLGALASRADAAEAAGAQGPTLARLAQDFSPLSAFAYLVFVLLYTPCASAMGALRRELGWDWMAFALGYGLLLAWTCATATYQLGSLPQRGTAALPWLGACLGIWAAVALALSALGSRGSRSAARRLPPLVAAPAGAGCGSGCGTCRGCGAARGDAASQAPRRDRLRLRGLREDLKSWWAARR